MQSPEYGVGEINKYMYYPVYRVRVLDEDESGNPEVTVTEVGQFKDRKVAVNFCDTWRGKEAPTS